jgi:uncharacterized protein DUF4440
MKEEVLKVEKGFTDAIAENDLEAIERFVNDDWIIINADGGIIEKERFLEVIKSGALTHEMKIHGAGIHYPRAVHRCFCEARAAMAVRPDAAHWIYETVRRSRRGSSGRFCGACGAPLQ